MFVTISIIINIVCTLQSFSCIDAKTIAYKYWRIQKPSPVSILELFEMLLIFRVKAHYEGIECFFTQVLNALKELVSFNIQCVVYLLLNDKPFCVIVVGR